MHVDMGVCTFVYISGIFLPINSIFQDDSADPDSLNGRDSSGIEPLPGLETILEELLREDGYASITISCYVMLLVAKI